MTKPVLLALAAILGWDMATSTFNESAVGRAARSATNFLRSSDGAPARAPAAGEAEARGETGHGPPGAPSCIPLMWLAPPDGGDNFVVSDATVREDAVAMFIADAADRTEFSNLALAKSRRSTTAAPFQFVESTGLTS